MLPYFLINNSHLFPKNSLWKLECAKKYGKSSFHHFWGKCESKNYPQFTGSRTISMLSSLAAAPVTYYKERFFFSSFSKTRYMSYSQAYVCLYLRKYHTFCNSITNF